MRKMMMTATAALLALAIGGCDSGSNDTPEPAPADNGAVGATTNYQAEVAKLSESQLQAVLLRAIRDAGLDCQGVTATQARGYQNGLLTWRATCTDGSEHIVGIAENGIAQVVSAVGG